MFLYSRNNPANKHNPRRSHVFAEILWPYFATSRFLFYSGAILAPQLCIASENRKTCETAVNFFARRVIER